MWQNSLGRAQAPCARQAMQSRPRPRPRGKGYLRRVESTRSSRGAAQCSAVTLQGRGGREHCSCPLASIQTHKPSQLIFRSIDTRLVSSKSTRS